LLNAVLFSLPGTPIIYYGDEIGMGDNIYLEDRDGVRTPMQWSDEKNAGFSTAMEEKLVLPVVKSDQFSYTRINVAAQQADPNSLFHTMCKMLAIRKANPVMAVGEYEFVVQADFPALLFIKRNDGNNTILALHNLSAAAMPVDLETHVPKGMQMIDLMKKEAVRERTIQLAPYAFLWLKAEAKQ